MTEINCQVEVCLGVGSRWNGEERLKRAEVEGRGHHNMG